MRLGIGRIIGVLIVASWVVLFYRHLSDRYESTASASIVDLSTPTRAELTQRGVFYRGARIGHIRERMLPHENGFRAEQEGQFTLTVLGRERKMEIEGSAELGEKGDLRQFEFQLKTSSRRSPFSTKVSGVIENDTLSLTITNRDRQRKETRRLDSPIVLPLNLYYSLASAGFTPGVTSRVQLFDPMTLSEGLALIEVMEPEIVHWGGREEEAYRLKTTFAGLTTTAWVNENGEVLKEETPLGWTLTKEAPESRLDASEANGNAPDVVVASALPAMGFAGSAESLDKVSLKLNNFPDIFDGLDGGRQTRDGDTVTVQRETKLPNPSGSELDPAEKEKTLSATAFIQADDEQIRKHALELADGLTPYEAARAISDWVHQNMTKSPTLSIPSAIEVFEQRVGDCNEHTVLFTALARAAKIPTRMATGLAYTGGQFYYHAWPEVWLGSWVAVDPTFGQFPADAMHLRLLTGGLENQYEILALMNRGASIEVLEANE